jgi:hypothetical protein
VALGSARPIFEHDTGIVVPAAWRRGAAAKFFLISGK